MIKDRSYELILCPVKLDFHVSSIQANIIVQHATSNHHSAPRRTGSNRYEIDTSVDCTGDKKPICYSQLEMRAAGDVCPVPCASPAVATAYTVTGNIRGNRNSGQRRPSTGTTSVSPPDVKHTLQPSLILWTRTINTNVYITLLSVVTACLSSLT
eukprot:6199654-Pleurochrysis_carterae.AAC.6